MLDTNSRTSRSAAHTPLHPLSIVFPCPVPTVSTLPACGSRRCPVQKGNRKLEADANFQIYEPMAWKRRP